MMTGFPLSNKFGTVGAGNYSEFEEDGTLVAYGNATVWEDSNIGGVTLGGPVAGHPDVVEFLDSGGGSTGVYGLGYAVGEKASGAIEIPHAYAEGTDLSFHLHFSGNTAPAGGTDNVQWQLDYFIVGNDTVVPAKSTITVEAAYDTQYERVSVAFADIDGTGVSMGDQFCFTLTRIAASSDDYAGDAILMTTGIHYQRNTGGSRQITTK